jgi:hypothetical protein
MKHNTTSLALELDFGGMTSTVPSESKASGLRLATTAEGLQGPDKYKVLNHRRRQAQIAARRLLQFVDEGNHV